MSVKSKILLIVGGAFVGFINGFLGAGGGILVVPLLQSVLKQKVKTSHATAIFVILPLCIVSGITYIIGGIFDYRVFVPALVGGVIGGVIGTFALSKFRSNVLVYIFSFLIIIAGVEILFL